MPIRTLLHVFVPLCLAAFSSPAFAAEPAPESNRLINVDQMQGVGQQLAQQKRQECLRAFAYDPFCRCLAETLPFQIGMQDYMRILANSPAELKERRKGLPPEEQQLIDAVLGSRDRCVQVFAPPPAPQKK